MIRSLLSRAIREGISTKARALEYALDTNAMTATLVWQFHHTPETFTIAMGNVNQLPNGTITFVGWGSNGQVSMTEVAPDNSTVFEMRMDSGNVSYRAFKYLGRDSSLESVSPGLAPKGSLHLSVAKTGTNLVAEFILQRSANVSLGLCNILGREVASAISSFGPRPGSIP